MKQLLLAIAVLLSLHSIAVPVAHAAESDFDYRNTFEQFTDGLSDVGGDLEEDTEAIELPTFSDEDTPGESAIVGAIDTFLSFMKLIIAPLTILFTVFMAIRMVAAGSENEQVMTSAKNYVTYAVMGLVTIFMADAIVNVIFGATGDTFRAGEAGVQEAARNTAQLFEGLYSLLQVIIGSVAVLMLVVAGMRFVAGSASDDEIGKAKKQITWSLVGLFVIAISEFVAKEILFDNQGQRLGVENAKQLFAQVTNFIAGTIGTLAFAFMLYAGYLYVTARDNEDQVSKAKKIIMGALLGILLAVAAFAITNTVVELDAAR